MHTSNRAKCRFPVESFCTAIAHLSHPSLTSLEIIGEPLPHVDYDVLSATSARAGLLSECGTGCWGGAGESAEESVRGAGGQPDGPWGAAGRGGREAGEENERDGLLAWVNRL